MNIKLNVFPDRSALDRAAADLLARHLPHSVGIMLSGGVTPLSIYRQIRTFGIGATLFLSDERCVPSDDPQSNYGTIRPCFTDVRFIRVETERTPQEAAGRFNAALRALKDIPLGLLGLGTDGHTASIFTLGDAALRDARLAIAVRRPEKPDRISVTPTLLNRIGRLMILATGPEKHEIIRALLNKPETLPAGLALKDHPHVELWTEQDV